MEATRWVIVGKDNANRIFRERTFEDAAGIDVGGGDSALADYLGVGESVALIEIKNGKNLIVMIGEEWLKKACSGGGFFEYGPLAGKTCLVAAAELESSDDRAGFGGAQPYQLQFYQVLDTASGQIIKVIFVFIENLM